MEIDPDVRNILVAHQFVAGAVQCESEEISIGELDQVDVSVLERFDYVALGHRPQAAVCRERDDPLLRNAAEVFLL